MIFLTDLVREGMTGLQVEEEVVGSMDFLADLRGEGGLESSVSDSTVGRL